MATTSLGGRIMRVTIVALTAVTALVGVPRTAAASNHLPVETWVTDGIVHSFAFGNGKVYLGGEFSQVGPNTGGGTLVHPSSGVYDADYVRVDGEVEAVVSDGSGGWYIGGNFIYVAGNWHPRVAHIRANGTVTNWRPVVTGGTVSALARSGNTLFIGGNFDTVDGESRDRLAAFDISNETVNLLPWNPGANGTVHAMDNGGGDLYIGGVFTNVDGTGRSRIASFDIGTGSLNGWDPGANNTVRTLLYRSGDVFAGGDFTSIGGASRNRLAEVDATTGAATGWNPGANGTVNSVAVSGGGSTLYAGGAFTSAGGKSRNNVAELRLSDGQATSWSPSVDGTVHAVAEAADGNGIYIAGEFLNAGGKARRRLAELATSTGDATSWKPEANGTAMALEVSGTGVYVAGEFTSVNGADRANLAALDASTGVLDTSWAPKANDDVLAVDVAPDGSRVYVAGRFTTINGANQNRIAALNPTNGSRISTWKASTNTTVFALAATKDYVYLGGDFSTANSASRRRLAAFDTKNGGADPTFSPSVDGRVRTMAVSPDGKRLYIAGDFDSVDGVTRNKIAAINLASGTVDPGWRAETNRETFRIVAVPEGVFAAMGGSGGRAYRFDLVTGATRWFLDADGDVQSIDVVGGVAYIGGHFDRMAGQDRTHLAAANAVSGTLRGDWLPSTNGAFGVVHIAHNGNKIWLGGDFTKVTSRSAQGIARINQLPAQSHSYEAAVVADGADLYWRLGDGGKATRDAIQAARAKYVDAPSVRMEGIVGGGGGDGAVRVNGRAERVALVDHPSLNLAEAYSQRTVELWVDLDDVERRGVVYEEGGAKRGISIYVDGGELYFAAWSRGKGERAWGEVFFAAPLDAGTPHHVVLALDGTAGTLTGYIDGSVVGTASGAGVLPRHGGNAALGGVRGSTRFHDGVVRHSPDIGAAGRIDDVAVYNRVLSPQTIAEHHALGSDPGR